MPFSRHDMAAILINSVVPCTDLHKVKTAVSQHKWEVPPGLTLYWGATELRAAQGERAPFSQMTTANPHNRVDGPTRLRILTGSTN